jgi:muramoyltetrapeptide carboxypeptidase
MIKPSSLLPGDKIAMVAPGRKIQPAEIEPAVKVFKEWGLEVVIGKNIHSNAHTYLAGTDQERLYDLQNAVSDQKIKAIISARGGYGSSRLIDQLDLSHLSRHPKWIIGFSDITALHLKLYKAGLMSVHGIMPIVFPKNQSADSIESLRKVLFEGQFAITCASDVSNRGGHTHGVVIGGNLSLIVDALGTSSEPDTTDCILIIEEIDEYRYRLDRMMTQLKRAGKLKGLKGLIIGHMTDIKDPELPFGETIEEIILDAVSEYNYPVVFKFPSGHELPNFSWIHGGYADLSVTRETVMLSSASMVL